MSDFEHTPLCGTLLDARALASSPEASLISKIDVEGARTHISDQIECTGLFVAAEQLEGLALQSRVQSWSKMARKITVEPQGLEICCFSTLSVNTVAKHASMTRNTAHPGAIPTPRLLPKPAL